MEDSPFYIFTSGFSLVLIILSLVRSYLYDWDRSYLYSAGLFSVVLVNCVFWIFEIDWGSCRFPESYAITSSPGIWFNYSTPVMLILLYREFLQVKRDNKMAYLFMTYSLIVIGSSALLVNVFTFVPDSLNLSPILYQIFTFSLLAVFTFLPVYTFRYFNHPYYKFPAISSWVIWVFFGAFYLATTIEALRDASTFLSNGDILFIIVLIEGLLFFTALSIKDKLLQDERHLYEKQAIDYQLKSLQNQMNPHFIFNSLNSIKSLNLAGDTDKANYYLDKIGRLIREILSNTKHQKVAISSEISTIQKYLDLEKLRLNDKFDYSIDISNRVDQEMMTIPPLMIQPYVENAVWHGISVPEVTKGQIVISIDATDDHLLITIRDNGIGINKSLSQKEYQRNNRTSEGLRISDERIKSLSHLAHHHGEIIITDRSDIDDQDGTRVYLKIPLL